MMGSRTLAGSGGGMLVVLIGFLLTMFAIFAAAGQSEAWSIFGFAMLVFLFLATYMMLGGGGRARMRW